MLVWEKVVKLNVNVGKFVSIEDIAFVFFSNLLKRYKISRTRNRRKNVEFEYLINICSNCRYHDVLTI